MFGERVQQPNCYQLEVIWSEVLDCFQQCSDTHNKLFRKYGELLTFDETGAYVRLSLFANSWLMRLNQQHLEKVVTSAFRSAYHLGRWHPKHSVFKRLQLSDKFHVGIEIKEICDYSLQQLLAFQYHTLDGLLPFSLSSLPLSKRDLLPTTSAVYFVIEGDSVTNCRVLYIGQSSNLVRRWKNHSLWKVFKQGEGNFRIAWLECTEGEVVRCIIEAAFIQTLQPEFNQNKHPAQIWTALQLIGWDDKAAEQAKWILGKIDKTEPEKKIFVAILQELLSTSNKLKPQPIPENWRPSNRNVVLWRYEGKYLPCHVREIVEENSEAAIYLSTTRETTRIAKEKGLKSARWGGFYVSLSELRPAQGLGLSILKQMALLGLA